MIYQPASWNTEIGRCLPGSLALIDYAHRVGFGDAGCYNDRAVRGAEAPSLHREGRAVDLTVGARNEGWLSALVQVLTQHYEALGVQQIIWMRRSWRCDRWGTKWKPYYGVNPHIDHAHIELNWHAANHLTVDHILATLHPIEQAPPPAAAPTITDDEDEMYFVIYESMVYRVSGNTVTQLSTEQWAFETNLASFVGKPIQPVTDPTHARILLEGRLNTRTGQPMISATPLLS